MPLDLVEQSKRLCKTLDMPALADRARVLGERCSVRPGDVRRRGTNGRANNHLRVVGSGAARAPEQTIIRLRCEGQYFTFVRGEKITRLGKVKGVRYVRCLLSQPKVPFHVDLLWYLVNGPVIDSPTLSGFNGDGPNFFHVGGFDEPAWDAVAHRTVRAEHARLSDELAHAEANSDRDAAGRLQAQLRALERNAVEAMRGMASGSTNNRRIAIQKAIARLYKMLAPADSFLEDYLHRHVKTGVICVYEPDEHHPVVWEIVDLPDRTTRGSMGRLRRASGST